MTWLTVAGGVFLVWLVLVFLFTPGINYHLSQRASARGDGFLYTHRVDMPSDGPSR